MSRTGEGQNRNRTEQEKDRAGEEQNSRRAEPEKDRTGQDRTGQDKTRIGSGEENKNGTGGRLIIIKGRKQRNSRYIKDMRKVSKQRK